MKNLLTALVVVTFPVQVLPHSGGTDENGCHAGSQPYHCHNGGDNVSSSTSAMGAGAWDFSAGYRFHIEEAKWIPFLGASIGKNEPDEEASLGINLGLKHQYGWYVSYVSTSESVQLGYEFFHVSANSDYFGIGFSFPFGGSGKADQSSGYYGGSILFSSDD